MATADEIDPDTLVRPVWGSRWTLPEAREILIGPKQDDFCFIVFPGDDSVGIQGVNSIDIMNFGPYSVLGHYKFRYILKLQPKKSHVGITRKGFLGSSYPFFMSK